MARFTQPAGSGGGTELPQGLATSSSPTFNKITLTSNGATDNITIGDDAIIGDGNVANHIVIIGQQDDTAGGIVLGTNETEFISTNGTDLSITADNDIVLYPGSNYAYLNAIDEDHRLATMADILSGGGSDAESTVYLVRNNTGSTISKGTLVSAVGAEPSGRIDIAPHETTGLQDSELRVMGMATSNISSGVNGTVMSFGTLTGLDTRGTSASAIAVGDETWAEGDILYAHPTADGKLTNVRPQHDLAVAFITVRHASSGQIAIRIVPGNNHLEWLHDVELDGPVDNQVLAYDDASGLWKNRTILSDTNWTGVTNLSGGFVSGGSTPGYRKINGVVYMRGNMHQGTGEATAFTLPEGFRPDVETVILAQKFGTSTGTYVTILADGSVKPHDDATWLSGISYPAG